MTGSMTASMTHVIGVDLGGTKTAAGVVSGSGEVLMSGTIPTLNRTGGEAILDATAALISGLVERAADAGLTVSGVGVGSAGVIDAAAGTVVSATDAILGWAGTKLIAGLSARVGLPVRAVNDVHAHALGEAWLGAAAGTDSSLMVAFGTGVGGSFVLNGSPLLGHRFVGGHVGHFASPYAVVDGDPLPCVCGGVGHVEAVASGPAIHAAYLRFGGPASEAADTRGVFAIAQGNHDADAAATAGAAPGAAIAAARAAVGLGAKAAGQALGGLINILDPEVVVVSGGLADAGEFWWRPMETALRQEILAPLASVPVVRATLGNTAAIVGAAKLVLK